jgi:hypothetical protein
MYKEEMDDVSTAQTDAIPLQNIFQEQDAQLGVMLMLQICVQKVLILKFRILKHTYCILISSIVFLQ